MRKILVLAISTFLGIGYLPLIPGTFASLAGWALYYFIKESILLYSLVFFFVTLTGFIYCGKAEEILKKKDSRHIVIDEVSGMLLSLFFLPIDLKWAVSAFILFRLLDTFKPYPASTLQNLKGSLGIMSDDLVAGLYTNIILQLVFRFTAWKVS